MFTNTGSGVRRGPSFAMGKEEVLPFRIRLAQEESFIIVLYISV
jgi:hypothetical protein